MADCSPHYNLLRYKLELYSIFSKESSLKISDLIIICFRNKTSGPLNIIITAVCYLAIYLS